MYRHWLACNSVLLLLLGIFFLEVFLGAFNTIWRYLWSISLCCPALLWRIPSRVAHPFCWRFASSSLGISFGITRLLFWGIFWTFFIAVFFSNFSVCLELENTSFLCFLHCYILAINWVLLASLFSLSFGLSGPSLEHQG